MHAPPPRRTDTSSHRHAASQHTPLRRARQQPAPNRAHASRARSDALSGGDLTELALWPKTGRTHQLRRYAAEILKAPIVGDTKYGGADAGAGLFLAAIGLRCPHPEREAEEVRAAIEPPPHFEELLRPDS